MFRTLQKHSKATAKVKSSCQSTTLNKLYEQRHETWDIKFIVDDVKIPAHRCVLAALSPKYKAQFYGGIPEKDIVHVTGVSAAGFNEFLQFFYMDEAKLSIANVKDVLDLANQSLADDLVTACTNFLIDTVGMDKLIWCYQLALKYDMTPLKEFCAHQIQANTKSIFEMSDFLHCEQDMLCHILDLDSLDCDEIEVLNACIAWGRAKCERDDIDGARMQNLRAALGEALFKIRFCSMTHKQFAGIYQQHKGLLSGEEASEVFCTISLKEDGKISEIFGESNSKRRRPLYLTCSFSTGSPGKSNFYRVDCLKFVCDAAINLIGFAICQPISDQIDVYIRTGDDDNKLKCTQSISADETIIRFDPIRVESNKWTLIMIFWDKKAQASDQLYGFNVMDIEQNGAKFQFPEAYHNRKNSITRFLFNIID